MNIQFHTVLIIEDNETINQTFSNVIKEKGFNVISTRCGAQAFAEAICEKPELVILGSSAQKVSNITIMKQLRDSCSWGKQVPIILLLDYKPNEKISRDIGSCKPLYCFLRSSISPQIIAEKIDQIFSI